MEKPIWISAGELSGDMHGAALVHAIRQIDPDAQLTGMGGDMLFEAGVDLRFRIEELSVMGFTEVLRHLPRIIQLLSRIRKDMERIKPKALIVIDAPDFHFRVIKTAVRLGIPVYYYISPKLWAWRSGRTEFIRNNVRKLISILPFEVPFYAQYGMEITYVGNPLVEIVNYPSIRNVLPDATAIGFLPGSRSKEISSLMPEFAKAAGIMKKVFPELTFTCFRAPNISENMLKEFWLSDVPLTIVCPKNRWAAMRKCQLLIAASGTVTLESALAGVPTIVCYKFSRFSYMLGRLLVKVPYMSLPNLIAGKSVFPELLQKDCNSTQLAEIALKWLQPEGKKELDRVYNEMDAIRDLLGKPGATLRAAECILNDIT